MKTNAAGERRGPLGWIWGRTNARKVAARAERRKSEDGLRANALPSPQGDSETQERTSTERTALMPHDNAVQGETVREVRNIEDVAAELVLVANMLGIGSTPKKRLLKLSNQLSEIAITLRAVPAPQALDSQTRPD